MHVILRISPEYTVSRVVGFIKRKSAIYFARVYEEGKRNFVGRTSGREDISSRLLIATNR